MIIPGLTMFFFCICQLWTWRTSGSLVFIIAFDKNKVTKFSEKIKDVLIIFCLKKVEKCFRNILTTETINKNEQIKKADIEFRYLE